MIEPSFEVANYGRWVVLRVAGEIDMATAPLLRQHVLAATARVPQGLVLDLDRVDFIDSTGLGVIVGAAKRMRVANGELRIVCSVPHLNELFALTRLNQVFELYEEFDQAVADIDPGPDAQAAGQ